jgi:hypothetical protein
MSLLQSLAVLLSEMGFVQLALAFLVVGAYSLAINGSFGATLRAGAGSIAFVAGVAFAALTPSWMSGVTFLALVVAAVAAFAAAAWLLSTMLGVGGHTGPLVMTGAERVEARAPAPQPARAIAPSAAVRSL